MLIVVALLLINVGLIDYFIYKYYKVQQKQIKDFTNQIGGVLDEAWKNFGNNRDIHE